MAIYLTSDTHFGHKNIIKHCNRPWQTVEEMNEGLVASWNSVVHPTDYLYHLGDVLFGGSSLMASILPSLHGRKFLVPGNHDRVKALKPYFEEILPPIFYLKHEGIRAILCHFPILSWENKHHGSYHFHGHTHGSLHFPVGDVGDYHKYDPVRVLDVGVDNVGYKPIQLEEAIERINGRVHKIDTQPRESS